MAVPNALIRYPVRFAATSYVIRYAVDGAAEDLPFPAAGSLTVGRDYWVSGDGAADDAGGEGDLLAMLETALEAHSAGPTVTVSLTAAQRVRIVLDSGGLTHQPQWAHVNTTLDDGAFGYASTPSADATVTGTLLPQGIWRPERPIARDSRARRPLAGGVARTLSGASRVSSFGTVLQERDVSMIYLPQAKILDEYVDAAEPLGSFENAWLTSLGLGRPFRLHDDDTSTAYATLRVRDLSEPHERNERYGVVWDVMLRSTQEGTGP